MTLCVDNDVSDHAAERLAILGVDDTGRSSRVAGSVLAEGLLVGHGKLEQLGILLVAQGVCAEEFDPATVAKGMGKSRCAGSSAARGHGSDRLGLGDILVDCLWLTAGLPLQV